MTLEQLSVLGTIMTGTVFVLRVLLWGLKDVYRTTAALVSLDLCLSILSLVWPSSYISKLYRIDYRVAWLAARPIFWYLVLVTLASLLSAILASYPGIAKLSRQCVSAAWALSILIGVVAIIPELRMLMARSHSLGIRELSFLGLAGERAVMIVALVVHACILIFLLWFPVRIPRNLLILSLGFLFYFATQVTALFAYSFLPPNVRSLTNSIIILCIMGCYLFWSVFLSRSGEFAKSAVNARLQPRQQERLLQQLELLNDSLARAANT